MDELDLRFEMIFKKINRYISKVEDLNMITKAYYFAKLKHDGINRIGGGPYMTHLLETADILVDLNAGPATIASGLLHDTVEDVEGVTNELIEVLFGKDISTLVDSLTKVNMAEVDKQSEKNYTIKKIFNAMGKDVRTIIVKLADRLSNMRSLEKVSQEHKLRVSKQTLEIYAPVARSIGFNKIGNELEELCLFYLDNARYHEIKNYIEDNLSKTSQIIQDTKENIENALSSLNIKSRLYVTTKDIYSIYKFLNNNKKFDEIDDLNVIHVIVENNIECYMSLGVIHSIYKPLFGRIKDYISSPKYNMYQAIHTLIITPDGRSMKIAIKSKVMDEVYNYGVASKWKYQEGQNYNKENEQNEIRKYFNIIKELDRINAEDGVSTNDYVSLLKEDVFNNNQYVYVYTPKGEVVILPMGATIIDFAFKIHTSIGESLKEAYINGIKSDLFTVLKNGSIIDLKFGDKISVDEKWLENAKTNYSKIRIKKALAKKGNKNEE